MNMTPRLAAHWPWLALAIVLLLLGVASWLILQQTFKEDLDNRRASSERELSTIAAFIASELQAGRYQDIEPLLRGWGEADAGIAYLQLAAANGFVLATYQRAGEVEHALTLEQSISYSYQGEARLHLRIDLADLYRHQRRLVTGISAVFAVGSLLLFFLVHVALQRQREAARLRQRTHELEQSEQRFRTVLENMQLIGVMLDRDGRIILCNDYLLQLTGWQREEVMQHDWFEIFLPPDIRYQIKEAVFLKMLRSARGAAYYENEIVNRRGERHLIAWNNTVFRDFQGQVLGIASIGEDITARRRAEKALFGTTERFRQALSAARAGAWEWNIVTNQVTWSQENFAVLGLDSHTHQASFETWVNCVHPEDREQTSRNIQEVLDTRRDLNLEFRVVWPNGEVRWINDVGRLVLDETGRPASMYGIQIDITERKQAQALKEANEERMRAIINASPVPKALNDEHQNITFLNPAFTETFGYTREDIPTLADWWPKAYPDPEYRQRVAETWQATLDKCQREGTAFPPMEINVHCKNGTVKTVLASAASIGKSFAGNHLVVLYDITARKHAEAEREHLLAELTAANVEMENFVYTISHDLKSPLITIGGFTSLLEKDLVRHDGAAAADSIAEIKKAATDMQRLIENLLQLARLGQITGEPREVDVNVLLEELRARCARHFEQEHATVRIAPDIPWLRVDPVRLGEVLQNLVENALKYHRPGVPPEIEIGWRHEGGWLRLYVRDNGIGIKKEYQERIFGLFQRLDSHAEGTGVGLTISRRIIESFGGRLSVESEPGEGCTFWIELPESVMVRKDSRVSDKDVNLRS